MVKRSGSTPSGSRKSSPVELGSTLLSCLPRSLMALGESSGASTAPACRCPSCLPSCTGILSFPLQGHSVLRYIAPSARFPSLAPESWFLSIAAMQKVPWMEKDLRKVPQVALLPAPCWADLRAMANCKTPLPCSGQGPLGTTEESTLFLQLLLCAFIHLLPGLLVF